MSDLRELYQQVILDHNKNPRNFREMADATAKVDGYNPLCGDHYTIFLKMADDAIAEVSFTGNGCAISKASVISFVLEGVHPHDIGTILDQEGVAIRTGHHCAQPLMVRFNVPATGRASFGLYNTRAEADALVAALHKVIEVFR